jgi:hypothetical protein
VFIGNVLDNNNKLKLIKDLAFSMAQNDKAELAIKAIEQDSVIKIKDIIRKAEEIDKQLVQQEAEAARASQENIAKMASDTAAVQQELERYKIDTEYKKAIDVANIKAVTSYDTTPEPSIDSVNYPDNTLAELNNQQLKERKLNNDILKQGQQPTIKRSTTD